MVVHSFELLNPALERQSQANLYEFGASLVYMLALGKGCIVRLEKRGGGETGKGKGMKGKEGKKEKEKRKTCLQSEDIVTVIEFPEDDGADILRSSVLRM